MSASRSNITWASANPFSSLKIIFSSRVVLMLSVIVFFRYNHF